MLALPDGWDFSNAGLQALSTDGQASLNTALKELKEHGYLKIYSLRDNKGHVTDWSYDVYEFPQFSKNPDVENPDVDSPDVENQHQLNTYSISSTSTDSICTTENKEEKTISNKKYKRKVDTSFVLLAENALYRDALIKWFEYKRSINDMYKTQSGAEGALEDLKKACGTDTQLALAIVDYCIKKEWKGIYDCKRNLTINNGTTTSTYHSTERTEHGNRYSRLLGGLAAQGTNT